MQINRQNVKTRLDTGTTHNVMSPKLAKRLNLEIFSPEFGDLTSLSGADGKELDVLGTVEFAVKIRGYLFPTTAFVVDRLSESLLIGSNFLKAYNAKIDFAEGVFFIDNLLAMPLHNNQQKRSLVRSKDCVHIPPYSVATINAKTNQFYKGNCCMVSEIPSTQFRTFAIQRIIVNNPKGQIPCRILNHTDQEIVIKPNQPVATIAVIDENNSIIIPMGDTTDHAIPNISHDTRKHCIIHKP